MTNGKSVDFSKYKMLWGPFKNLISKKTQGKSANFSQYEMLWGPITAIPERVVQLSRNFFFLKFFKFFFVLNYSRGGTAVISSSVLTGPVQ
jgi:hypothetical protein